MADLTAAHRGYEYQDILTAARLVDVLLGSVASVNVDQKLVNDDRFDDLTVVDINGSRERAQFKHRDDGEQPLELTAFSNDARELRLDRLLAAIVQDYSGPGATASKLLYRLVLRDAGPTDPRLAHLLQDANPDPGPFIPGMTSRRFCFNPKALLRADKAVGDRALTALAHAAQSLTAPELAQACSRLVIEVEAPAYSGDLTSPGPAEQLLLNRVRTEVGAEQYPNQERRASDVAGAIISAVRAARQGRADLSQQTLLRRTQLRHDFGAVARAHPVDPTLEVRRRVVVSELAATIADAAGRGQAVVVSGPPGQGKSWVCHQLLGHLEAEGWLLAEHYCFLNAADGERLLRVLNETLLGSLLRCLADVEPSLVADQRPRFAADEQTLVAAIKRALDLEPERRVALFVDGIDHVTRVRNLGPGSDPSLAMTEALAALELPIGSTLVVLSQPGIHLRPLVDAGAREIQLTGLNDQELHSLAAKLGVVPNSGSSGETEKNPLLTDPGIVSEFLEALANRSAGNALYATYLCREASLHPETALSPGATLDRFPAFDGTLENYYGHLHDRLSAETGWVADVIGLLTFAVTRAELKDIRPDMSHRVDAAVDLLAPVLVERSAQGGVRVYHESFSRYLRKQFQQDPSALVALLNRVCDWLLSRGFLVDTRAFESLLPLLAEAQRDAEVVGFV